MLKNLFWGTAAVILVGGCAGPVTELQMRDTGGAVKEGTAEVKDGGAVVKTVVFPNGTVFGGASKDQASKLAQIFVDSHNMSQERLSEIKEFGKESLKNEESLKKSARNIEESTGRIEDSARRLLEAEKTNAEAVQKLQKNSETAQKALQLIENLSSKQGSGEITVFFNSGSSRIHKGSGEYNRLIQFIDYLSRESKGRKILFISIGSASSFGDKRLNQRLGQKRSESPVKIIDQYLVNVPHEYYKIYGTGDNYSPKGVKMYEHQRYQHTRLIAVFETDQIPALPEETAKN